MKNKIFSHFGIYIAALVFILGFMFLIIFNTHKASNRYADVLVKSKKVEVKNVAQVKNAVNSGNEQVVVSTDDNNNSDDVSVSEKQRQLLAIQNKIREMRENTLETIQEIHIIKQNTREIFVDTNAKNQQNKYEGLTTDMAINSKIIPPYMISPKDDVVADDTSNSDANTDANNTDMNNSLWGKVAINRFGGLITIESVGPTHNDAYFKITYSAVPKYICEALLLADWDDSYIGTAWIGANGHYFHEKGQNGYIFVNPEEVKQICGDVNYVQIGFK